MKTPHRIQTLLSCGIALAATFGMATAEVADDDNKGQPGTAQAVAKPAPAPTGVPASELSNPHAAFTSLLQAVRVRDVAAFRAALTAADEDRVNMQVGLSLVAFALTDLTEALAERSLDADNLPRWQESEWDEELARVPQAVITVKGETATLQLDENKLMPPRIRQSLRCHEERATPLSSRSRNFSNLPKSAWGCDRNNASLLDDFEHSLKRLSGSGPIPDAEPFLAPHPHQP